MRGKERKSKERDSDSAMMGLEIKLRKIYLPFEPPTHVEPHLTYSLLPALTVTLVGLYVSNWLLFCGFFVSLASPLYRER